MILTFSGSSIYFAENMVLYQQYLDSKLGAVSRCFRLMYNVMSSDITVAVSGSVRWFAIARYLRGGHPFRVIQYNKRG